MRRSNKDEVQKRRIPHCKGDPRRWLRRTIQRTRRKPWLKTSLRIPPRGDSDCLRKLLLMPQYNLPTKMKHLLILQKRRDIRMSWTWVVTRNGLQRRKPCNFDKPKNICQEPTKAPCYPSKQFTPPPTTLNSVAKSLGHFAITKDNRFIGKSTLVSMEELQVLVDIIVN